MRLWIWRDTKVLRTNKLIHVFSEDVHALEADLAILLIPFINMLGHSQLKTHRAPISLKHMGYSDLRRIINAKGLLENTEIDIKSPKLAAVLRDIFNGIKALMLGKSAEPPVGKNTRLCIHSRGLVSITKALPT